MLTVIVSKGWTAGNREYNLGPMKVVIAPQSFKGSVSGPMAAKAIDEGLRKVFPQAETVLVPVADGGDGTLEALVKTTSGQTFSSRVLGPLRNSVNARWGVMGDGKTAVIEMAQASGLVLVPFASRNPKHTTTHGTGQLIKLALNRGYRRIIVGMGGSATNDGGAGMAWALGARFRDKEGQPLPPGGAALASLASIDLTRLHPALKDTEVIAASDVDNPLCGPTGASAVYGPQKGATVKTVEELDKALERYASVIKATLGQDVANRPGAGAAGGMGAGLMAFANGEVRSGIDIVCEVLDFDKHLKGADLVITGEGRLDASTAYNKAPVGVARRAAARGIPVIALAGSLGRGFESVYDHGISAAVCIVDRPMSMRESVAKTYELLASATERSLRLLNLPSIRP